MKKLWLATKGMKIAQKKNPQMNLTARGKVMPQNAHFT